MNRKSAEVWPVGYFIENEMRLRGWTRRELAERIGGGIVNRIALDILMDTPQKGVLIGNALAHGVARAFDTSPEMWINLDKVWQEHPEIK